MLRMAWRNIRARKFSSMKVTISMIIIVIILCVFTSYSIALGEESHSVIFSYRSGHYFLIDSAQMMSGVTFDNVKGIDNINHINNYGVYSYDNTLKSIGISIGGVDYRCEHSSFSDIGGSLNNSIRYNLHTGQISIYDNSRLIGGNDIAEAEYRWEDPSLIMAGSDELIGNNIMLSEYFLDEFGLDESVLGQKMSLSMGENTYSEFVISGILNKNFYKLTGKEKANHILMSKDASMYEVVKNSNNIRYYTEVYVSDYMSSKTVAEDILEKAGVASLTTGSDYGLAMASTVTIVQGILNGVMGSVGAGIVLALFLNIIFSMRFMVIKKANYYGIVSAYGMNNKGLFLLIFFEMAILAIIAIALAYLVSYGLIYLLDFTLTSLIGLGVVFTWQNFLITFVVAFIFTPLVVLSVTLVNYSLIAKKHVVSLLRHGIDN